MSDKLKEKPDYMIPPCHICGMYKNPEQAHLTLILDQASKSKKYYKS